MKFWEWVFFFNECSWGMPGVSGGFAWWLMHAEARGIWRVSVSFGVRNEACPDELGHSCFCLKGRWAWGSGLKWDEFPWLEGDDAQNFRGVLKANFMSCCCKILSVKWLLRWSCMEVCCENRHPHLPGYKNVVFVQTGTIILLWTIKPWVLLLLSVVCDSKILLSPQTEHLLSAK